jgi:glycosyltransferase involved in cell wall biosynthesis
MPLVRRIAFDYAGRVKVLVGIPTHRRPDLLRECLESVAQQEGELPNIEVFVADNDQSGREGIAVVDS